VSDWTGGEANRQYRRGTRPEPDVDTPAIAVQVRRYLHDCERFAGMLGPAHPTAEGVLKIVFHRGDAQKRAVLAAFRELTGTEHA
jgi:hypothetical protein